jgi:hypothetical protein
MFNVFTDVPLPGRFFAYNVDDLNFSSDPKSILYGEKAGIPFAPVGIYDYANRLVTTVETDYNGLFDVLLPSTNRINCPTPSGVCANVYRFVGNDPGIPGRLNPNYNSQFRTIAAEFEAMPGVIVPADTAPTQMGVTIQLPGSQQTQAISCTLNATGVAPTTPELWTVSKPYADLGLGAQTFTITGQGFGASKGTGSVTLDGTVMTTTSWNDRQIVVSVPTTTLTGPHQLAVKADNGRTTVNGLTFHVLSAPTTSLPSLTLLDDFNRANTSNTLGANWSDLGVDIVSNRARGQGQAFWNVPSAGFGANQGAAFTFGPAPLTDGALVLKATGGSSTAPQSFIRVRYTGSQVRVESTTNYGISYTNAGTQNASFAAGDTLSAVARSDGSVSVFKTSGATTTFLTTKTVAGSVGTGVGRTGISLPNNVSADNFRAGAIPATGPTYRPALFEVGTGKPYATVQAALDAAAAQPLSALVVVYPGTPQGARINPRGAYYENLIITSPVKLQGVGPGGIYPDGAPVTGSIVDGGAFGGDTALADAWREQLADLTYVGQQDDFEGPVMTVLAQTTSQYGSTYKAAIDGFQIRGGDLANFPNNIDAIGGGSTGLPANVVTQGGGIFVNAYAHYLQITNNIIQSNAGSYAGGVRIGTPDLPAPDTSQHNDHIRIANNRILANSGTNLAGGIGLFAGSDSYEITANDLCANFSAEYGGGISAYGLSPNGSIHDNRIYFNRSFDEGGGIMIAGQLPTDPTILSPGSGPVDILRNVIQANLANDDGGGIRFLMAGNFPMNVVDNVIANNIATHEGGGIAIDDTPNVRIVNDTIVKNMTTATAATSTGQMAPAGVSTGANSDPLQATLPSGSPTFSSPTMFNDIFWDNRAGTRAGGTVTGLGIAGDASPIVLWDVGAADGSGTPAPTNSMLHVSLGTTGHASNTYGVDPTFISEYDTSVTFLPWRTNPNQVGAIMVATDVPPTLMGDYHIPTSSPARDAANSVALVGTIAAPTVDIDGAGRPTGTRYDLGADELPGALVLAFPKANGLDQFTRADGGLGSNWDGATSQSKYRIQTGQVQVRDTGTVWWRSGSTPGANQEAFVKLTKLGTGSAQQGLLLKLKSPGGSKESYIRVSVSASGEAKVYTKAYRQGTVLRATLPAGFVAGDQLGVRTQSDGSVTVFRNGVLVGSTNVATGSNHWAAALAGAGGRIGVIYSGNTNANDATFDDFGGGTLP